MSNAQDFVDNGSRFSSFKQKMGALKQGTQLWLVGTRAEPHYRTADIHKISNVTSYLVVASATAGGASLAGTLVETANIALPYAAPVGLAWTTALILLDRAIIQQDNIAKANRLVEQMMAEHMNVASSRLNRVLKRALDMTPALMRIALVAAPMSFINTQSALNLVLHNDILTELKQEHLEDNAVLFQKADDQKIAYDARTAAVQAAIEKLQSDLKTQRAKLLNANSSNGVTAEEDRVRDQIEKLRQDAKAHSEAMNAQQARYQAELAGATREGTSGMAGRGKNARAAQIAVNEEKANIAAIDTQISELGKTGMDSAKAADTEATAALKKTADTLQNDVTALQDQSATAQQELEQRRLGRTAAFDSIDQQAVKDSSYKPPRQGPLANTGAMARILTRPETSMLTKLTAGALATALFGFEISAVLISLARKPVDGEIYDAVQRERKKRGYGDQLLEPMQFVEDPTRNPSSRAPMTREDFLAAVAIMARSAKRSFGTRTRPLSSHPIPTAESVTPPKVKAERSFRYPVDHRSRQRVRPPSA